MVLRLRSSLEVLSFHQVPQHFITEENQKIMDKRFKINVGYNYLLDHFKERAENHQGFMLNHIQGRGGLVLLFDATFRECTRIRVGNHKVSAKCIT